jgi:hypothetical protein
MEGMHATIENLLSSGSTKTVSSFSSLVEAVSRVTGSCPYAASETGEIGTVPNCTDGSYRDMPEDIENPKPNKIKSVARDETPTDNASSGINTVNDYSDKQATGIHILIIEGFLIFNDKKLADLCHCKYFLTLTRQQCWERRSVRTYDPPDVPGYFDQCIWPEYEKHRDQVFRQVPDVIVIDGNNDRTTVMKQVLLEVVQAAHELLHLQKTY